MIFTRLALILLAVSSATAFADEPITPKDSTRAEGGSASGRGAYSIEEIGARLGVQLGIGGQSAGGLRVGGDFLYRLAGATWSDSTASVVFGSGDAACVLGRGPGNPLSCDHGLTDGFAFEVGTGIRWYPGSVARPQLAPYLRGGVGLSVVNFSGDSLTGVAIPLFGGGGVRYQAADWITIEGEADVQLGPGFYGRGVGVALYSSMIVQFGVEFAL